MKNKAVHHDKCRVLLLPKKVERELKKIKKTESTEPQPKSSPKKTRANLDTSYNRDETEYVMCKKSAEQSRKTLWPGTSKDLATNLEKWALESKNWAVHGRLQTCVDDACAADIYWHTSCYTDLKNKARTAKTKAAKAEYPTNNDGSSYDPLVFSQLIAYSPGPSIRR